MNPRRTYPVRPASRVPWFALAERVVELPVRVGRRRPAECAGVLAVSLGAGRAANPGGAQLNPPPETRPRSPRAERVCAERV
jgi:hypothetical protein